MVTRVALVQSAPLTEEPAGAVVALAGAAVVGRAAVVVAGPAVVLVAGAQAATLSNAVAAHSRPNPVTRRTSLSLRRHRAPGVRARGRSLRRASADDPGQPLRWHRYISMFQLRVGKDAHAGLHPGQI
jgi:hypothetical protein